MELTYFDLFIGLKFRAQGAAGRLYEIVGLRSFNSHSEVTIKRLDDPVDDKIIGDPLFIMKADRFLILINRSEILNSKRKV